MANTIKIKRGSGSDPSASDLVVGELAVRTDTGKLFTKKDDNSITQLSGGGIDDGDKGDLTVSNDGATFTIDNGVINNAKVASDAAIAGSKIDPSFTSGITITNTAPSLAFVDSNNNSDFTQYVDAGVFHIRDTTNSQNRLSIASNGTTTVQQNLDVGAGLDVTGNITVTGTVDGIDVAGLQAAKNSISTSNGAILNGVTATTQSAGDNSTKIATTAYTDTAISNLVDSAPGTLNTLNELAAALGDDANFSTTVTNSIATKLPLAGGTLTGALNITNSATGVVLTRNSETLKLDANYGNGGDQAVLASASLRFYANGTEEKMRILANGNVGIANTSPSEKLDVTGNIKLKNTLTLEEASGSESYQLSVNSFGGLDINNDTTKIAEFTDANTLNLLDNVKLTCGTDSDLQIYHDGSNSFIDDGGTGNLVVRSNTIAFEGAPGSGESLAKFIQDGAVELYHNNTKKLHTDSFGIIVSGGLALDGDNLELRIGNGQDLKVYHDGNHTYIDNHTGQLKIRNAAAGDIRIEPRDTEAAIVAKVDGAVELYYDNDLHFSTSATGVFTNGSFSFRTDSNTEEILYDQANGKIRFNDNKKANFGSDDDLQIFHTGTNGKIIESTGNAFQIQGDDLRLQSTGGEHYFIGNANGAVALYHNNSHKISTATYGAVVRGDGSSTDGTIQLNCSQNSHGIKIKSPAHSAGASYTFTFPTDIQSGKFLTVDSSGNTSWGTPTNTNTQLSNEQVQDIVGAMVSGNTESGITVTYQDGDGTLDFSVASQTDQNFTTTLKNKLDGIAAGATNVTNNNQLTNGAGYITSAALSGAADGGNAASLDGIDSSQFIRSDVDDTMNGDLTIAANHDVRFTNGNWSGNHTKIQHHGNKLYIVGGSDGIRFRESGTDRWIINGDGDFVPAADSTYDIGTSSVRVANGYFDTLYGDASNLTNLPSSGLATTGGTLTGTLNSRAIIPTANNSYDLGSTSKRWRNVYTSDLQMSNEGSQNDVDMTWGSYTIQEGHHDLFLINKRTGKKYKFLLKEVG